MALRVLGFNRAGFEEKIRHVVTLLSGAGAHFFLFTAPFLLHLYLIEFLSQTAKVQ